VNNSKTKAWPITKRMVWEAFKAVKRNKGVAGIDGQTIVEFEMNLQDNLYLLWNRMSSGSYFPPAVKLIEIPKGDGKLRILGVPTVMDRIAQTVAKQHLEPKLDPLFHESSYGYRPKRSAHDALGEARLNCWAYDWILDLDIRGFFDNLDHELLMRAVEKHSKEKWVLTYISRWLKAPIQDKRGIEQSREKGTPQGSSVSPILANLFLHYTFDKWMEKEFPTIKFERYVDDIIVHCRTEKQTEFLLEKIKERMKTCKLELHPEKTKIVYCRDSNRKANTKREVLFTFLGYDFKPRESKSNDGYIFRSYSPGISQKAKKEITKELRGMQLHRKTRTTIEDIGEQINPKLRGWINYYGKFTKSALRPLFYNLNITLLKWVRSKFKKYKDRKMKAVKWLKSYAAANPSVFVHWTNGFTP
jgi:RNA-directed DNA polymerase